MAASTENRRQVIDQEWEYVSIDLASFEAAAWTQSHIDTDMNPLETLGLLWMIHHLIFDRSIDDATMERIDDAVGDGRWMTLSWDPNATIITLGSKVQTATARAHNTTPTGTIWFTPKRRHGIHGDRVLVPSKSSTSMVLELNWLLVAQEMQPCATLWYKPTVLDSIMAQQLACTLSQLTYCALNQPGATIGKWDWVTTKSKAILQRWNPPYLPTALPTLADILQLQVQKRPNSSAICAWDGEWTYRQLATHATMIAGYLIRLGVQPRGMVALRADKSKWSVAAMVAILKIGATCIPIDVRNPVKRVGQILKQTKAQILVTTQNTARINLPVSVHEFIVPQADQMENQKTESLPEVDLNAVAFVFYTSGSTGVPKGVIQSHRAISGALKENLVSIGLNCDSRTFQYASYAFDPCIMDIFGTFSVGGCVCIPSESQRLEELASTICHMRASHLCVTPTILATLSPGQVSTLDCVSMGGESVSVELVQLWSSHVRLVALYGTTESVQWDTYYEFQTPHDSHKLIGRGIKSNIWIVDPDNPERLMPLGAIGELLVSGPLVADGYLDDDVKTRASFIQAPSWLRWFRANRADRLYRTGDLARYHSDGNIEIIGRRDRQVKINGQRIELSEIESALRLRLPSEVDCVAEVISLKSPQDTKTLAMFLYSANGLMSDNLLSFLRFEITQDLPAYMIPSAWITLESPVPRTLSGKVDRSILRRLGAKWSPSSPQCDLEPPTTNNEKAMQHLWRSILHIEPLSLLYRNSDFFYLGGTSVSAIRLVGMARTCGLRISIADIFRHGHRLRDLAATAISIKSEAHIPEFAPFSLLDTVLPPSDIRTSISKACQVSPSAIHDVLPCSPLQEGLVALTQKHPGTYVVQIIVDLPEDIDLEKFQRAYTHVVATNSILRTRFVTIPDLGSSVQQVVVDETPWWWFYTDIEECCRKEREQLQCRLGDPMLRCSIFDNGLNKRSFVWTLHHALFDGWSLALIFNSIQEEYLGRNLTNLVPYQRFVAHLSQNIDYDACHNFWKSELDGACFLPFPPSCPATYQPSESQGNIRHSVDNLQWPSSGITPSTVIRAAWALLLSQHTGCQDVVFGVTVSGRQADIPGIDQMAGPTIATIPVRMRMDTMWSHSASEYLSQVQLQALSTIPYEQIGLSAIRCISAYAEQACQFQTLLVVQPPTSKSLSSSSSPATFMVPIAENITSMSHTYAIMLQSWLRDTGVTLDLQFDETIYSGHESQRILWQLESIIRQLCSSIEADEVPNLTGIDYASPHDPVVVLKLVASCR